MSGTHVCNIRKGIGEDFRVLADGVGVVLASAHLSDGHDVGSGILSEVLPDSLDE